MSNVKVARDAQSFMSKSEVWHGGSSLVVLLLRFAHVDLFCFFSPQVTTTELLSSLSVSSHPQGNLKSQTRK